MSFDRVKHMANHTIMMTLERSTGEHALNLMGPTSMCCFLLGLSKVVSEGVATPSPVFSSFKSSETPGFVGKVEDADVP